MHTRRPVAVFLASLALAGAASISGCGAESLTFRTGTPADHAQLTTGNDPAGDAQGNLPNTSNRQGGSTATKGGVGEGNANSNNG
jgi:hypothetical protein